MRGAWAGLLAVTLVMGCARQEPVRLSLRLDSGRDWTLEMTSATTVTQTVDGRVVTVRQKSVLGISFRVVEWNAAGVTSLEAAYDYIALEVQGDGATLEFDTRDPSSVPPEMAPLARIVGANFGFPVDSRGRVGAVTGLDRILADVVASAPEGRAGALSQTLEAVLGPEAVRGSLASVFVPFPPDAVAMGGTWVTDRRTGGSLGLVSRETWSMKSLSGGRANLTLQARTTSERPDLRIEGTQDGSLVLDLANGMLWSATLRLSAEGSFSLLGREIPLQVSGMVEIRAR